jgi:WD40 repeat protein
MGYTSRIFKELIGHTKHVKSAAFSYDGTFALTGAEDKKAILWKLGGSEEKKSFNPTRFLIMRIMSRLWLSAPTISKF